MLSEFLGENKVRECVWLVSWNKIHFVIQETEQVKAIMNTGRAKYSAFYTQQALIFVAVMRKG